MIKYLCPKCKNIYTCEEWNSATIEVFGKYISVIEGEYKNDAFYICPSCNKEIDGEDIKKCK